MATTETKQPDDKVKAEIVKQGTEASATLVRGGPPSRDLVKFLSEMQEVVEVDPEAAAVAMIERVLAAESVSDVWVSREATHAKDIIGSPIYIDAFDWQQSDYEGGLTAYAVLQCRRAETGEAVVVTCGSKMVMATVWKLDQLGALPVLCRFMQSTKPTRAGFLPLNLEPLSSVDQF